MTIEARPRPEVLLGIKYQERLHFLHCRLYRRARYGLSLVSLAAGSAALVTALQSIPGGVTSAAVVVAASTFIDVLSNFSERSAIHNQLRRRAADLKANSAEYDAATLDRELGRLMAEVDNEVEALRAVAYNDCLASSGYEDGIRPESRMQRLMRALA